MLAEQREQSSRDAALGDPIDYGRGEVVETLARGRDFEASGELFHVYV